MKKKAETTAPETAAEDDAALVASQLAADAERDRLLAEQEAARIAAEAKARRVLAVFDSSGVLVGRNDIPTDEEWEAAPERCRFANGFDNAIFRYKIVEFTPGRWRFEPIPHDRDKAAENSAAAEASIMGPLVRYVMGRGVSGDAEKLEAFLSTFDAQG